MRVHALKQTCGSYTGGWASCAFFYHPSGTQLYYMRFVDFERDMPWLVALCLCLAASSSSSSLVPSPPNHHTGESGESSACGISNERRGVNTTHSHRPHKSIADEKRKKYNMREAHAPLSRCLLNFVAHKRNHEGSLAGGAWVRWTAVRSAYISLFIFFYFLYCIFFSLGLCC